MKVTIDRFEGKFAVCELPDGKSMNVEKSRLPKGAKEGDVLDITDDKITIDKEETEKRRETINKLTDDLFD